MHAHIRGNKFKHKLAVNDKVRSLENSSITHFGCAFLLQIVILSCSGKDRVPILIIFYQGTFIAEPESTVFTKYIAKIYIFHL